MQNKALVVVDIQTALLQKHPKCQATLMECLRYLIAECRGKGIEVIYIRHDDGPGTELEYGSEGWQIDGQLQRDVDTEPVFDKRFNSAFKDTALQEYLAEKGIQTLVVAGMQTEYCVDATIKSAFDLGYTVWVPSEGVTTFDNAGLTAERINEFFLFHIWNGRYAEVMDTKDLVERL